MIEQNVSLQSYNTFGIDVFAAYFVEVNTIDELKFILKKTEFINIKKLFLGGGSNILFLSNFDGLVIKINFKGINIIEEDIDFAIVKAGAGEVWHEFVLYCIDKNLGGIENLSLIPGTVGAAPMQNIGAYGVEVKNTFYQLEALNLETLEIEFFDSVKCNFGYRESFFKHDGKNKYVILNVSFKLSKNANINVSYGAINDVLREMKVYSPTIKDVSNAVIQIRRSKLPDPKEIGNAGSFFKNPEITATHYNNLKIKFTEIPGYPINDSTVKVPAGWLIENAGWKGKRFGDIGVHNKQALVLVNFGKGTGNEIASLAKDIQKSILEKYDIEIYPEVNFV